MKSSLEKQAALLQEADRSLRETVESLHGWLLAFGGFLERAEAAVGRLSGTPAYPLVIPDVGKVGMCRAGLYVCFSPSC
jgi:hypothetical protein